MFLLGFHTSFDLAVRVFAAVFFGGLEPEDSLVLGGLVSGLSCGCGIVSGPDCPVLRLGGLLL